MSFHFEMIQEVGLTNSRKEAQSKCPSVRGREDEIAPKLLDGKNIIIAAHGNSLRALSKYIENISDDDIIDLETDAGQSTVYDFNDKLSVLSKEKY